MKAAARRSWTAGGRPGRGRAWRRGPAVDRPGTDTPGTRGRTREEARGGPTSRGTGADPAEGRRWGAGGPRPTPERASRRGAVERGRRPWTKAGRRRVAPGPIRRMGRRRGAGGPRPTPERAGRRGAVERGRRPWTKAGRRRVASRAIRRSGSQGTRAGRGRRRNGQADAQPEGGRPFSPPSPPGD